MLVDIIVRYEFSLVMSIEGETPGPGPVSRDCIESVSQTLVVHQYRVGILLAKRSIETVTIGLGGSLTISKPKKGIPICMEELCLEA